MPRGRVCAAARRAQADGGNRAAGGETMQMLADQVCWVPISEIADWEEPPAPGAPRAAQDSWEGGCASVLLELREGGGYTLLAGLKRLKELRALGQNCVDAVITPRWNLEERISGLLSRLLKGNVHYVDEAEEYHRLLETGLITRQELAARLGRSQATLQRKLRLLNLGEETRRLLRFYRLSEQHAQAVLRIPGEQGRRRMVEHIGARSLSLRETEALVEETLARMPIPVPKDRRMIPAMRDHRLYINAIRGIVEQMQDAGLHADMQVRTGAALVEVRLSIPCFTQPRRQLGRG